MWGSGADQSNGGKDATRLLVPPAGLSRSCSAPELPPDELSASMALGSRMKARGTIMGGVSLSCQRQENPNISAYGVYFDLVASFSRVKVQDIDFGTYAGRKQEAKLYLCKYGSGAGYEADPDAWREIWSGPISKWTRVTPQEPIEVSMNKVQGVFIHCAGDGVCLSDKGKNALDDLLEIRPGFITKSPEPFKPFADDETKVHTHAGLVMYMVPNVVYRDLQEMREDYEERIMEEKLRRERAERRLKLLEEILVKQGVIPEMPEEEPLPVKAVMHLGHKDPVQSVGSFLAAA